MIVLTGVANCGRAAVTVRSVVDVNLLVDAREIAVQYLSQVDFLTVATIIRAGRVARLAGGIQHPDDSPQTAVSSSAKLAPPFYCAVQEIEAAHDYVARGVGVLRCRYWLVEAGAGCLLQISTKK